jgi:hypothetical protein
MYKISKKSEETDGGVVSFLFSRKILERSFFKVCADPRCSACVQFGLQLHLITLYLYAGHNLAYAKSKRNASRIMAQINSYTTSTSYSYESLRDVYNRALTGAEENDTLRDIPCG